MEALRSAGIDVRSAPKPDHVPEVIQMAGAPPEGLMAEREATTHHTHTENEEITMTTTDTHAHSVPRTSTGESASDLIEAWSRWCPDVGATISLEMAREMAKQIKGLIIAQYTTSHIKYGLAIWTIQKMDNSLLSPWALDDLTWKYATDTSAQARRWRARTDERVEALGKVARQAKARRLRNERLTEEWEPRTNLPKCGPGVLPSWTQG